MQNNHDVNDESCTYYDHSCVMMKLMLIKRHGDDFQMIAELKKQISELETKTLSELPPDAQQTIQSYKDRFPKL